ncbi:MAG: VWA domain-containing protein [Chitinophagaceae bacterium]|nr:VWA domain-containing protein [Chitinophagaceae bacterium]
MNPLLKTTAGIIYFAAIIFSYKTPNTNTSTPVAAIQKAPVSTAAKIQVAILLDVSNSMDGLIDQAKAQLWNMVNVMGKVQCNGQAPPVEIALYEYGRSGNNPVNGYVKQISPFSADLDQLSRNLFGLTTNGGEEFCGHVIYSSLNELNWDTAAGSYKVIFIAGNEDFLQGDISFSKACAATKQKGVIVNTIFCGERLEGIKERWNLGGECGNGSYANINPDAKTGDIETPYDSTLFSLNEKLNRTYITYGTNSVALYDSLGNTDRINFAFNKSAGLKRISVKAKKNLYRNKNWDLVDAYTADSSMLFKMKTGDLPDSLQKKSMEEVKEIVKTKTSERDSVQAEIGMLNAKRESYIVAEKAKKSTTNNEPTLETEIEKIIRGQVKRFNMQVL